VGTSLTRQTGLPAADSPASSSFVIIKKAGKSENHPRATMTTTMNGDKSDG